MAETENSIQLTSILLDLQRRLETYHELVKRTVYTSESDYTSVYINGFNICDCILRFVVLKNGFQVNENGTIIVDDREYHSVSHLIGTQRYIADRLLPRECQRFIHFIRSVRNQAVHVYLGADPKTGLEFARAMDYFTRWFVEEHVKTLEDSSIGSKISSRFFSLEDIFISPQLGNLNIPGVGVNVLLKMLTEQTGLLNQLVAQNNIIEQRSQRIESGVQEIQQKVSALCERISDYQSLVDRQIHLACSEQEVDRLLHAYTEECTGKILNSIKVNSEERLFELEKQKLISSFGQEAWNKLDEASKTFIISAKLMYSNQILLDDSIDYSGVCLLVTKSLEVEMNKRFCRQYLDYLYDKYEENYSEYPTPLLGYNGRPLELEKFTMGSYAYIMCRYKKHDESEEQVRSNKRKLIEYASSSLFPQMDARDIEYKLNLYANQIEDIRKKFRNPAAHTNKIKRCDAEACFNVLLDVEKLLKKMLDSFVK